MANTTGHLKIIVTESILLKQIELSDAADIFKTIDGQRTYLGKWLPFVDFTRNIEDSEKYIQSVLEGPSENRGYIFAIHCHGTFAGLVGLKSIDNQNKKAEIGYWLSEPFQKQGIITASVKALMQFAYDQLNINRIQIKCAVGNIPSKNIPIKLGYRFEGIERAGELLSDGEFADIEVYSILKDEYVVCIAH